MVLPLLRITQGKKRVGARGHGGRGGGSHWSCSSEREQDLRKTEEREREAIKSCTRKGGEREYTTGKKNLRKSYVGSGKSERVRRKRVISE